eukprot:3164439-Amphidinium_carterae.1
MKPCRKRGTVCKPLLHDQYFPLTARSDPIDLRFDWFCLRLCNISFQCYNQIDELPGAHAHKEADRHGCSEWMGTENRTTSLHLLTTIGASRLT